MKRHENDYSREASDWLKKEADREIELLTARKNYIKHLRSLGFTEEEIKEMMESDEDDSLDDLYLGY